MYEVDVYIKIAMVLMAICSGAATIISYTNRKRFHSLKFFYTYPLSSFMQMSIYYTAIYFEPDRATRNIIINSTINIFVLIELILIYRFYLTVLQSITFKIILYLLGITFIILLLFNWLINKNIIYPVKNIFLYEAVAVLIPGITFFIKLFNAPIFIPPSKNPNVWLAIGIVFYFGCTLPLFLMINFIVDKNGIAHSFIYIINYICYSVFFLLIAKAYLCPKTHNLTTFQS